MLLPHPRRPPASFLGLAPNSHSPSPVLLPTDHSPLTCPDPVGVPFRHCIKSFTCNIYGSPRKCCKQKTYATAKPFRCTYKKQEGRGIMVSQESDATTENPSIAQIEELRHLPQLLGARIKHLPDRLIRHRRQLPLQHFILESRCAFMVQLRAAF